MTATPNELMAPIHDQMPVILRPEDYATWLDPATETQMLLGLLRPFTADETYANAVSTAVNKPVNDSAENVVAAGTV